MQNVARRRACRRPTTVVLGARAMPATIENISTSGALLRMNARVPIGSMLLVFILGEVCAAHVTRLKDGRAGIRFDEVLNEEAVLALTTPKSMPKRR
ncbi:hypothetical protein AIOL_001729 [Candidatus Rhodobacter oscarellae]|uniref:PilZ domain-containing protein n=1 Tax=Candidatus Rhodobacter oscarellae TaxID=1675527 RepID=A0A0J9GTF3_9RHOB|nr:hypothetical protein AIOL_001729 [Candidatus Rhodobacter lobularis]